MYIYLYILYIYMTDLSKLYELFIDGFIYKESNMNIDYWVFNHHKIPELYIESINDDNDIFTVCMVKNTNADENVDVDVNIYELVSDIKLIYIDDLNIININTYDFIDGYFTFNKECIVIKLKSILIN